MDIHLTLVIININHISKSEFKKSIKIGIAIKLNLVATKFLHTKVKNFFLEYYYE
jgi:hypothetical protein